MILRVHFPARDFYASASNTAVNMIKWIYVISLLTMQCDECVRISIFYIGAS